MLQIKVVNTSHHPLPKYETPLAAGLDLRACLREPVEIGPLQRVLVPTGIRIEMPEGYEAQIRPRSGLALKQGVTVLNAPGTIDADYRGEINVILINLSDERREILDGDRIAQMVFAKHERVEWLPVSELSETKRGSGAYGHTGLK
ncbi:MAG: dUTP diphosphatase [Flavobacteriales bacterium]|nr:dUTP diphosphatase [Flavobacteriales bacterium]